MNRPRPIRRTTDLPRPCGTMPRPCHGSGRSFSRSNRGLPSCGARARHTRPSRTFCVPLMCQFRARPSRGFAGTSCSHPVHGSSTVLLPEACRLNHSVLPCHPRTPADHGSPTPGPSNHAKSAKPGAAARKAPRLCSGMGYPNRWRCRRLHITRGHIARLYPTAFHFVSVF